MTGGLADIADRGKVGLARALGRIEAEPEAEATLSLLDEAWVAPRARTIGITGPPGVGKSTLLSALIQRWRVAGRSVAVLAVDPTSRRSGGAILGDRTRLDLGEEVDAGVFVRSLAARERLGGTASLCPPMLCLMAALHDIVVVETVGVGQSETDVTDLVDLVLLAVQPGSGDALQFMKAGIAEIPDIAVVTKADLGAVAERAARELEMAIGVGGAERGRVPVLQVSAATGAGMADLVAALDAVAAVRGATRERRARAVILQAVAEELGRRGVVRALHEGSAILHDGGRSPFRRVRALLDRLG